MFSELIIFKKTSDRFHYCSPFSKKVKKKKQSDFESHSAFFPLSEESIRNDLRSHYASKEGSEEKKLNEHDKKKSRKQKKLALRESVRQREARLADIPIPLNVEPITDFFEDDTSLSQHSSLGYSANMSPEQAYDFFKSEMERHGWRCMSSVSGTEKLFYFVKPDKFCSVSIRPHGGKQRRSDIIIFSGQHTT